MNEDAALRSGERNAEGDKGTFQCAPKLSLAGEAVYLCSNLTGNASLLPNGAHGRLARFPLVDRTWHINSPEGTRHNAQLYKAFVDGGGSTPRELRFSLWDYSGNLVPLGESDWSCQLCLGYPT